MACSAFVFLVDDSMLPESKEDFAETLMPALTNATGLPVACLEYRHAPTFPHPAQALDSVAGLEILTSSNRLPCEGTSARWNRNSIYVIGHSVGAFIALSLVLQPPKGSKLDGAVSSVIRRAIRGVVCVDGIYDLPSLLEEYPDYKGFVGDAFGAALDGAYLEQESPARWELVDETGGLDLRILVLHSREDELLSLRQPGDFATGLEKLLDGKGRGSVEIDYESLKNGHAQLLLRDELPLAVRNWIQKLEGDGDGSVEASVTVM